MAEALPREVSAFHEALARLPGVYDVTSAIESLEGLDDRLLGSIAFAHVPQGAFRRTAGSRPGEAFIYVAFRLEPKLEAWRTLEFLAWFATDQARGGELLQLRPLAAPPVAGPQVQLGHTLRFQFELFRLNATSDLAPHLAKLAEVTADLVEAERLYSQMLRERGAAPITPNEA
jgi:hypothetical protein